VQAEALQQGQINQLQQQLLEVEASLSREVQRSAGLLSELEELKCTQVGPINHTATDSLYHTSII
jgi:hypothetical protein